MSREKGEMDRVGEVVGIERKLYSKVGTTSAQTESKVHVNLRMKEE